GTRVPADQDHLWASLFTLRATSRVVHDPASTMPVDNETGFGELVHSSADRCGRSTPLGCELRRGWQLLLVGEPACLDVVTDVPRDHISGCAALKRLGVSGGHAALSLLGLCT